MPINILIFRVLCTLYYWLSNILDFWEDYIIFGYNINTIYYDTIIIYLSYLLCYNQLTSRVILLFFFTFDWSIIILWSIWSDMNCRKGFYLVLVYGLAISEPGNIVSNFINHGNYTWGLYVGFFLVCFLWSFHCTCQIIANIFLSLFFF